MSKRELERLAVVVDADAPRAKRRRETTTEEKPDVQNAETTRATVSSEEKAKAKEEGLRLWQAVKDAVDKEGRLLSTEFLRLPSKRQYAHYYTVIKKPISLDEIKTKLTEGEYASLDEVKHDFDTCFRNAKRYNVKDSQIWLDAKALHKVTTKAYAEISGNHHAVDEGHDDDGVGHEEEDHHAASADEGFSKVKKPPNMNRLLTTRLQKLVQKTDENGNALSSEFMELPNKKQWAIYYKTIARPMSFEKIFKHLKRKEYHTSQEFANDVELVFSNAQRFNDDHTPLWEAAESLKQYFHVLMSDLPPPYALPQYASAKPAGGSGKIRLKLSGNSNNAASTPTNPSLAAPTINSPVVLKVPLKNATPAPGQATSSQTPAPLAPKPSQPMTLPSAPYTAPPAAIPQPTAHTPRPTQTFTSSTSSYIHYPTSAFQQQQPQQSSTPVPPTPAPPPIQTPIPAPPPMASLAGAAPVPHTTATPLSMSNSPAPAPQHPQHPLKSLRLTIKPMGRTLDLDHMDGVKIWSLRLVPGEMGLKIGDVAYLDTEEEEESSDDGAMEVEEEEKEEEEEEEGDDDPEAGGRTKNARSKGQGRGRGGRKGGGVRIKDGVKLPTKRTPPPMQVRLDKTTVKASGENEDSWDVEVPIGSHILELGEKGGAVWKVYIQRM